MHEHVDVGAFGLPVDGLNAIPELDEFDDLYGLSHSNTQTAEFSDPVKLMSAVIGGGPINFDFESEADGDEARSYEEFNLGQITMGSEDSKSNLGDSDADDGLSDLIEQRRSCLQPVAKHAHTKQLLSAKPASKEKALTKPLYDPVTCRE